MRRVLTRHLKRRARLATSADVQKWIRGLLLWGDSGSARSGQAVRHTQGELDALMQRKAELERRLAVQKGSRS